MYNLCHITGNRKQLGPLIITLLWDQNIKFNLVSFTALGDAIRGLSDISAPNIAASDYSAYKFK